MASAEPRRVALAGDVTLELLADAVASGLAGEGEAAQVHTAPFGSAMAECLDPGSALRAFRPDTVVLVPDSRAVAQGASPAADWVAMWDALERDAGCAVIQQLAVPPAEGLAGPAERRAPDSAARRVQAFNDALLEAARGRRVSLLEADRLAAQVGLAAWHAPRYWFAGKLPFDPRFLPDWTTWFRAAWRSSRGRVKKALVLDLDDTLWGGTIGDDGVEGIALGPDHGARGEAFLAWQRHVAQLARRGVVLAVCSKNSLALAAAGFTHPAAALRREDFASVVCDWGDKASMLRRVAGELNLGLDALVFADDNPVECALVREHLPEVAAVDLGGDPAQFIARLEAGHWFDQSAYTDDDLSRHQAYAARAAAQAEAATVDLATFLQGLQMRGALAQAQAADLPRLAQLEQKTNQFNLTTRRHSQAQLQAFAASPSHLVLALRLRDKFGDHGLVSSLVAVKEGDALRIDSWVMSCRVFSRTAEQFMLAGLLRHAGEMGATALVGEFVPSARNAVAADVFRTLGFEPRGAYWHRPVALAAPPSAISAG